MSDLTTAKRYALALLDEAAETNATSEVDADIAALTESLEGSRDLQLFFVSPVISLDKKRVIVDKLFSDKVSPLSLRFLHLVMAKGRGALIPEIISAYKKLSDEKAGIVEAQARSAMALSDEEATKLTSSLEAMTGKKVRLDVAVDPDLIGGLVVRIGDQVYDGSVRNRLNALKASLERGSYLSN